MQEEDVAAATKATQFGDLNTLRTLIAEKRVSPDQTDADGCCLLHWAAINNRLEIAQLLVHEGATVNYAGGILMETPLQWAIRKRGIRMVSMLLENGSDIHHKDVDGLDALSLSVKLGYLDLAFIFLWKGADANTTDVHGCTPLLMVCRDSPAYVDMIRLLLKFGAKTELNNISVEDGKEPLHMCLCKRAPLITIWTLVDAGCSLFSKDASGYTPFGIAFSHEGPFLVRFLTEAFVHRYLPRNFPVIIPAIALWSFCFLVACYGWLWGVGFWFLWFCLVLNPLSLGSLPPSNKLSPCGFALGAIGLHIFLFHVYFNGLISAVQFSIAAITQVWVCVSFVHAILTPPKYIQQGAARGDLVAQMIMKQPSVDGPAGLVSEPNIRICTTCLTDKSLASMHCSQCNRCVVDLDHHCPFVNNCVGAGNRMEFIRFLLAAVVAIGDYLLVAYHISGPLCGSHGLRGTSFCLLREFPALAISNGLAAFLWVWIACLLGSQLYLIGAGTSTYLMISGEHQCSSHGSWSKSIKTAFENLKFFFRTGAERRHANANGADSGGGPHPHSPAGYGFGSSSTPLLADSRAKEQSV